MSPAVIKAIDAVEPYQGGDNVLWRLHRLNNVDKHRALLTAGSAYRSVNLGAHMRGLMEGAFSQSLPVLDAFFRPADRLFPLKAGDELFIDAPDAEVNENIQFRFEIAFSEPQVIEGEAMLETLSGMVDRVNNIVLSFKPFFA